MKIPEHILKGLKKETYPKELKGGQSVGRISPGITLTHEDLNFSITVECGKSQFRNYEFALIVFELYLQECKIID